jgi:ribosome biogenesis protein YTM1
LDYNISIHEVYYLLLRPNIGKLGDGAQPHRLTSSTFARGMSSSDEGSGSDSGSEAEQEREEVRVRVRFTTQIASLRVTETPIAVPAKLRRYGLSEVINHLLGTGERPTPFHILVNGSFLRGSLAQHMDAHGMSGEVVVELEYLPALRKPQEDAQAEQPDWVSAIASSGDGAGGFVSGCYDGALRLHAADCTVLCSALAHTGPIHSVSLRDDLLLTGGKDTVVKLWKAQGEDAGDGPSLEEKLKLVGHGNSVTAGDFLSLNRAVTGDWDGGVCLWDVSIEQEDRQNGRSTQDGRRVKPKRGRLETAATKSVSTEKVFAQSFKAHSQCVSGIGVMASDDTDLCTVSWDRSIKLWNVGRMDCVQTVIAPKAVTCMDIVPVGNGCAIATGHADASLRLWDSRSGNGSFAQTTLRSHKKWITCVRWLQGTEHVLVSSSEDGCVKFWDSRSHIPLHSISAHEGSAMSVAPGPVGTGSVFSGGSDGLVRKFTVPHER